MNGFKVVAIVAASASLTAAAAADRTPKSTQDPPGRIAVDQPAGVGFQDRDTARDTTDPMHAPPYADLRAPGKTPRFEASAMQPGAGVPDAPRASTPAPSRSAAPTSSSPPASPAAQKRSGADAATGSSIGTPTGPSTGTSSDAPLGTDTGYGTGTEPPPRR